jgi:hypothetical protein
MKDTKEVKKMQEIIEALKEIRNHQPNGELKRIEKCVTGLAAKVDDIHNKIMDPENGLIVQTNKNTEFRTTCEPEREALIEQFRGVLRWKRVIEWGLGVVFVGAVGAFIKVMMS